MAKQQISEQKLGKILDEALKNISSLDIEIFLYYESDIAL